jgi:hypothetical protein
MTQLGEQEIEPDYHKAMNAIAHALDDVLNGKASGKDRETGFVLLVFPFGDADERRCNFISNVADRANVVDLFKEMIAKFEDRSKAGEEPSCSVRIK